MILLGAAWAQDAVATTVVQVRPDALGDAFVGGWQSGWGALELGRARLEGYGELGWPAGVDQPLVPEIYVLTADGRAGAMDWTFGRQRLDLPTWGRRFDGGRARWSTESAALEAWAGVVGALPVGRLVGGASVGPLRAVAGVWAEEAAFHPDLRLGLARGRFDAEAIGAVAFTEEDTVVERARLELGARPLPGVRTTIHAEHRDAALPSILGELAPEGVDEAGVALGWSDARRSQLWTALTAGTWLDGDERRASLRGEVSWRPTCAAESWCVTPSWRGVSSAGGVYQALGATAAVPLPAPLALDVHGIVVPYRKPQLPWGTAVVAGATVAVRPSARVAITAGGELLHDAGVEPRGWLSVKVTR